MMQDDHDEENINNNNNNNNVGMIVGIACSLIVIFSIIAVGLFIHRRKKEKSNSRMNDIGDVAKEVEEGGGEKEVGVSVEPDLEMGSSVMMFSHDDE